jgi:hypothetical protein
VRKDKKMLDVTIRTYDPPGREDFLAVHPFYLSDRSIYIVCCDMSRPLEVSTAAHCSDHN